MRGYREGGEEGRERKREKHTSATAPSTTMMTSF